MEKVSIKNQCQVIFTSIVFFTVLLGLIYPMSVTFILQNIFPHFSNGSLLKVNDKIIGSELIGQSFYSEKYFWSRLSATQPFPYNSVASKGSNLSPNNPLLLSRTKMRIDELKGKGNINDKIPIDLVSASASGLDPHISIKAARYQIQRIAKSRNLSEKTLHDLITASTEHRQWGILGEPRVNVLILNLKLDKNY